MLDMIKFAEELCMAPYRKPKVSNDLIQVCKDVLGVPDLKTTSERTEEEHEPPPTL
jgi:hypothetical protein